LSLFNAFVSGLVTILLPRDSATLAEKLQDAYKQYVILDKPSIPEVLVSALVVAEDHRFYSHSGVDLLAILRAIWRSSLGWCLVGGSTIEQQLVRTLTGRKERSINRKLKELALACCVARYVPKSEVPGLYLSVAYFGWRMNGVREAYARLGIEYKSLTSRQAAELVARLKYPDPSSATTERLSKIFIRRDYILGRLHSVAAKDILGTVRLNDVKTVSLNR